MNRVMITATNTLSQLQKQMDIHANNMANVDTTGFKRREASFGELLVQQFNNQPAEELMGVQRMTPEGVRQGVGAKLAQAKLVSTQGSLKSTDRALDFALTGEGQYFRILQQTENGAEIRYTRDGSFHLTPSGNNEVMLVTGNGDAVLGQNNEPITFSSDVNQFTLLEQGRLQAQTANGGTQTVNLGITVVHKPQYLTQIGENMLSLPAEAEMDGIDIYTDLAGQFSGDISLSQGVLEQSNVDLSKEMTDLMNTQRSYQFQSRSITMADQMMGLINGIR
ncbi:MULTISPECIES: flagellar hook-basal body protein [Cytobacillus]|uniref:flagellar hook-basal body protein n=1 Tax=Cytobacillus TaxID=2675230 RepID=UPI001CD3E2EB|nr:flagellar hook-basal body protein [Cytobacillus kochii]MCA1026324.1 flagellar hook-basal body protein [Cytobacillus kochii]MDM5209547.1 flagellar hook-basal body protein [Cytobacillus kochii]